MRSCIVLILKQQNNEIEVYSSLSALIKARKENLGISKFTLDRLDLEKGYENNLRERGFKNITKMVYAFKGKEVKMEVY